MASEQKLGEISKALNESIERIDALQNRKALPLSMKIRQHLAKNSGSLTSVLLAGCIFAVAAGRLNLKSEFQVRTVLSSSRSCMTVWTPESELLCRQRRKIGRRREKSWHQRKAGTHY